MFSVAEEGRCLILNIPSLKKKCIGISALIVFDVNTGIEAINGITSVLIFSFSRLVRKTETAFCKTSWQLWNPAENEDLFCAVNTKAFISTKHYNISRMV